MHLLDTRGPSPVVHGRHPVVVRLSHSLADVAGSLFRRPRPVLGNGGFPRHGGRCTCRGDAPRRHRRRPHHCRGRYQRTGRSTAGSSAALYAPAAPRRDGAGRRRVRDGDGFWPPMLPRGRAWRPFLSLVEGRVHQPAKFCGRLQPVQPRQRRTNPVSGTTNAAGTATADLRSAGRCRGRRREAAASVDSQRMSSHPQCESVAGKPAVSERGCPKTCIK